ncbi:rhomboid family intramembrane serine protease [Haloarcula sp. CBA1130]|uniref:rhomboid family intramembrane serine protease n=1 Tax=unclassified Haloarcula TaxID=2624677 RepID=UPI0012476516|nr:MULTISPECIES: rhomboid family intramembrane serine protease [unclassified Haloarcula]KAA9397122.1 rhomboid family intramembrane serine protease [Haloarcula sp. CBA1129]KAA9402840.1 rhomboid family intramembrane serine protease [Haloarcula sp. CBA1130]
MMQSLPTPVIPAWLPWQEAVVLAVVLAVLIAARRFSDVRLGDKMRARLLLGVPWGTLLTMAGVAAVYLFLQGAWWHPRNPLVTPFRTWSYFYPFGMLTGAFTHGSQGHLTGNLMGTLVYGTVAEYVWGHYPRKRGVQTFTALQTNPLARILAVPVAMFTVGVFSAVFAIGPIVGFSGVVFAIAGFALVTRPTLFLGALLGSRVLDLLLSALRYPVSTASGQTRFVTPWWSSIAIQGHALGILAGVIVALALLWNRDERPDTLRVFFATLVFAVAQGLWAVYLPLGGGRFRLFRWVGTALVFVLALTVAAATVGSDRSFRLGVDRRPASLAVVILLVALSALSFAAIPTNLVDLQADQLPEDGIEVRDYVVTYDENVPNAYFESIWVPTQREGTSVNASGVIVASAEREIWIAAVQPGRLAVNGQERVTVGGPTWRESVSAKRTDWSVLGNASVYRVQLRREGGQPRTAYTSEPSTADVILDGRNVTVAARQNGFDVVVTRGNETVGQAPLPANMTRTRVGGLTFERNRSRLYARTDGTRVKVAERRQQAARS